MVYFEHQVNYENRIFNFKNSSKTFFYKTIFIKSIKHVFIVWRMKCFQTNFPLNIT